jgi:hypothetical protein
MRPTPSVKRKTITVAARITEREYAALKALAEWEESSITSIVRSWIKTLPTYERPIEVTDRRQRALFKK